MEPESSYADFSNAKPPGWYSLLLEGRKLHYFKPANMEKPTQSCIMRAACGRHETSGYLTEIKLGELEKCQVCLTATTGGNHGS